MSVPGVHHLPLPTPFQVGAINTYLLQGPPLTLVDAGPHTDEALVSLNQQLSDLGYQISDLEQILITHPHMDHFGLAGELKRLSGCSVCAHPEAVAKLADFEGFYAREQDFFGDFLRSMGVPPQAAKLLTEIPKSFSVLAPPVEVDQTITGGQTVEVGKLTFELIETPGHSPASICFYDKPHRALFSGDHIIDGITPNPLMEMPQSPGGPRPKSLVLYRKSLDTVSELALDIVFSGHRNVIHDPQRVIDTAYDHLQKRSERVMAFVSESSLTAYELMGKLFPNLPATEQFLGISEALGHLEWLEHEGKVRSVTNIDVVYYEVV